MTILISIVFIFILIQIVRFPKLFIEDVRSALIVWLLIGIVSLFMEEKLSIEVWVFGAGGFCLFCACCWFMLQVFVFRMATSTPRQRRHGPEIEYVDGEVVVDPPVCWNPAQMLGSGAKPKWYQRPSGSVVDDVTWVDWQTCKDHPNDAHFHHYDKAGNSVCEHK